MNLSAYENAFFSVKKKQKKTQNFTPKKINEFAGIILRIQSQLSRFDHLTESLHGLIPDRTAHSYWLLCLCLQVRLCHHCLERTSN